jgi:asparagine synthase (glutamine-hydrolysing)
MGSFAAALYRSSPPSREVATRMVAAAPHRGAEIEHAICGSAILAVSYDSRFRTAWLTRSNGAAVAFVGDLDNHRELAAELAAAGFAAHEDDPSAIVLKAFQAWGQRAPSRFRGAFSGAFSDGASLVCFRDQPGLGTLFFRDEPGRAFWAASEAKQVLAGAGKPREPDVEAVEAIFWGVLGERGTALKGVDRFPRASLAVVDHKATRIERYWDPRDLVETVRMSVDDARECLVELLEQAVARTVRGNDAVSLSGGIDAPTVAAFAAPRHRQLSGRSLAAVSHVYPDHESVDETRYIRLVSDYLDLDLHTYVPEARWLDDVDFWVDLLDGPTNVLTIPGVAEHYRRVRSAGARTILSGDLAEFVFTMRRHLIGHLVYQGRWREAARWVRGNRARGRTRRRIAREMARSLTPAFIATRYVHLRHRGREVTPWILERGKKRRTELAVPARRRWLEQQLSPVESPVISFEGLDICAEYCGVRDRRPLVDVDLWEFVLGLRAETKFPDHVPKSLLRGAMRGRLPDELLDRIDKTAFDEHVLATADYAGLRRWILNSNHRLDGIDYDLLRERIEKQTLGLFELIWAYDLARAHAFLGGWD